MSQARPSRRCALVVGAATAALFVAGPAALSGCTAPAPEAPDPLESPARRAEADAALAAAVADLHPTLASAARALAADRRAHAATLHAELLRVHPNPVPVTTSTPAVPPPVSADLAAARSALTQAIHAAQDEAAALVLNLPGYRAALLASVSACCATHAALLS